MAKGFQQPQRSSPSALYSVIPIHATPILVAPYPDSKQLNQQIEDLLLTAPWATNEGNPGIKLFFDSESVLLRPCFASFRRWIEETAQTFAFEALGLQSPAGFKVTDSWINETSDTGSQIPHIHTNSFLSGTYYIKRLPEHSPLIFPHPRRQVLPTAPTITLTSAQPAPFTTDFVISPGEGELVLWESHLLHGYPPSGSGGRRSLSMNLMPDTVTNGVYGFRVTPYQQSSSIPH